MTEHETVGWHHQLNEHEFEQEPKVVDGQGGLACCSPWGHKESDKTETELNLLPFLNHLLLYTFHAFLNIFHIYRTTVLNLVYIFQMQISITDFCITKKENYHISNYLQNKVKNIVKTSRKYGIFHLVTPQCSVQFSSVVQSCPTLCDPMNHSTPGLPVHHQLPEFTQTHVHRVSDAIQPSHPLSSPSPAPNASQHQSPFQ